ncbi:DUF378 domain-containing protein [Sporosarcina sp. FSL K6-6792]|uniref:DUF378 domain-containing protein n=1 Tax=Sporosarcina sp. FSL K6-6792 TaxID=2921559 RepID=UPI0030F80BE2
MRAIQRIALALVIIGAINWGLIGIFKFDLVASIFGGQEAFLSRVIYVLVGLSGLVCLGILFKPMEEVVEDANHRNFRNLNYDTEFGEETDFSKVQASSEKKSGGNKVKGKNKSKGSSKKKK